MFRRGGLLIVLTSLLAAGCSIDRVEWESTGFVVEAATQKLEDDFHVEKPFVECIQRDSGQAFWKCRAHAGAEEFTCRLETGPREVVHEVECERKEPEPAESGTTTREE